MQPAQINPLLVRSLAQIQSLSIPLSMSACDRTPVVSAATSLMQLAVVERQLIMQCLDFTSLAQLACTSKQLRAESVHPQCGAFLSDLGARSPLRFTVPRFVPPAHSSPLFRAHIPMHLHIPSVSAEDLEAALEPALSRLTLFRKINGLRVPFQGWPESVALRFLAHPCAASISSVSMAHAQAACPSPAVERALWSLPCLTLMDLGTSSLSQFDLQSVTLAKGIRHLTVSLTPHHIRAQLAPLSDWPLQTLTIREFRSTRSRPQVFAAPLTQLTKLTLFDSAPISHAQSRVLFSQLPALVELNVQHSDTASVMLGAGDIGQAGLPALRVCTVQGDDPPTRAELRRFLWRLPRLDSFVLQLSQFSTTEQTLGILRDFSAWGPPVSLDFGEALSRPPPMPHIDDAMADIQFDSDSSSSDDEPADEEDGGEDGDGDGEQVAEEAAPVPEQGDAEA